MPGTPRRAASDSAGQPSYASAASATDRAGSATARERQREDSGPKQQPVRRENPVATAGDELEEDGDREPATHGRGEHADDQGDRNAGLTDGLRHLQHDRGEGNGRAHEEAEHGGRLS